MLKPGLIGSAIGKDTVKIHTSVTIIQLQTCCETNMATLTACNMIIITCMYVPRMFLKQCKHRCAHLTSLHFVCEVYSEL